MGGLQRTGRLLRIWRKDNASFESSKYGFTIVEVMIVLAVSGGLFIAAAILISGKQNQAGFNSAIQQIQVQIQQTINDVSSGYFPNSSNFQCTAPNGGPLSLTGVGSNAQGTNVGCVFAGKAVQFQVQGTDPERFAVLTIAAAQRDVSGQEITSLATATPKVVAPGVGSPSGYPDLTTTSVLQNGLATLPAMSSGHPRMWYNNGAADVAIGAVAFVPSFATYNAGGDLKSGSQQLSVYPVAGTSLGLTKPAAVDVINSNLASSTPDPSNGVSICFASGGTKESGLVVIGGAGHPLAVTLKIMDGTTTCGK
ncbi:MAG TPA: prepilin-type N-terminal cleavage/methylation domain-containing protein [Patescibacteria group bacterium]|nr:prepilin-type N-terminal cleavage/methylation domain-containing protein [Patescibacteria group bacterium]